MLLSRAATCCRVVASSLIPRSTRHVPPRLDVGYSSLVGSVATGKGPHLKRRWLGTARDDGLNSWRESTSVLPPQAIGRKHGHKRLTTQVVEAEDGRFQAAYLESLMAKAGEISLKFHIIDAEGNMRTEQGTVHKMDLCKQHDLDPRDLRKLDSVQPNLVPTILSRRTAIIVNMLHVRALIKADTVIIFDPAGSRKNQLRDRLLWHIQANIKARRSGRMSSMGEAGFDNLSKRNSGERRKVDQAAAWMTDSSASMVDDSDLLESDGRETMLQDGKRLSYEHRALESILVSVAIALEEEMKYTRELVNDLLADLEFDISRDNLRKLLYYSRRIAGFQSRAKYVLASIEEVLESDEDLSAMYLSAKKYDTPRALTDHEELELLLESFSKQVEEIVSELDTMTSNMTTTQEVAELILDSNRNALIAMDLKVSIATLGVGVGAFAAGVFGMNLTSGIEEHSYAFYIVTSSVAVFAAFVVALGFRRLRLLQRVGISARRQKSPVQRLREMLWSRSQRTPKEEYRRKLEAAQQGDARAPIRKDEANRYIKV